jgi:hypothetical protein
MGTKKGSTAFIALAKSGCVSPFEFGPEFAEMFLFSVRHEITAREKATAIKDMSWFLSALENICRKEPAN